MTLKEAIVNRHSVRQYSERKIEKEKVEEIRKAIEEANEKGGLHLQLVTEEPQAFAGGLAKYGKFSGVANYIALISKKGKDEEVGYYGESVVLLAQTLGLNSCWVGLTFSKQPGCYSIGEGEVMHGVIALGYGATQGVAHPQKPIENFCNEEGLKKTWFKAGMEAAVLAPTAMNMQKFKIELLPDGKVRASTRFSLVKTYLKVDLGIVRYHFEVGAGKENVHWAE